MPAKTLEAYPIKMREIHSHDGIVSASIQGTTHRLADLRGMFKPCAIPSFFLNSNALKLIDGSTGSGLVPGATGVPDIPESSYR